MKVKIERFKNNSKRQYLMVYSALLCMGGQELKLEEKIGEGRYRNVYRDGDFALKVVKSHKRKTYFGFPVNIPTWMYLIVKFGFSDFNKHELGNYQNF